MLNATEVASNQQPFTVHATGNWRICKFVHFRCRKAIVMLSSALHEPLVADFGCVIQKKIPRAPPKMTAERLARHIEEAL